MENEVKQRNQRNRRRERAQRMQAQRESKAKDGDSGEDESPAREKPPRPPARRRRSREPLGEEDIIDGFAIMAFRTYEDLEAAVKCATSPRAPTLTAKTRLPLAALTGDPIRHPPNNVNSHGITLLQDAGTSDDSGRASERLTGSSVAPRDPDSSRDRLSDASSRCSSGKGYICDSEGDDDKASPDNSRNGSPRYHDVSMEDASDAGPLFRVTGVGAGVGGGKNELVARGGSGGALALSRAPVGGSASPAPAPLPQPAPSPAPAALPPPALPPPASHRQNGAHIPAVEGHAGTQIPARPVGAAGAKTPERPAAGKLQAGARATADSPTPAPPAPPAPSPLFPSHAAYQAHAALPDYRHTNHEARTEGAETPATAAPAPLDLHSHHIAATRPSHVAEPAAHPSLAGRAQQHSTPHPVLPGHDVRNAPPAPAAVNFAPHAAPPHPGLAAPPSSLPNQSSAGRPLSPNTQSSRSYPASSIGSSHVISSISPSVHSHPVPYQNLSLHKHSVQPYGARPPRSSPFSITNHIANHLPSTTNIQTSTASLVHPLGAQPTSLSMHLPTVNPGLTSHASSLHAGPPTASLPASHPSSMPNFSHSHKHPGLALPPHHNSISGQLHNPAHVSSNHMDSVPPPSSTASASLVATTSAPGGLSLAPPTVDSRLTTSHDAPLPIKTESVTTSGTFIPNGYPPPPSAYAGNAYPSLYAPYATTLQHSPYLPPAAASPRNSTDTRTSLSASPLVAPKTPKGVRPHTPGSTGAAGAVPSHLPHSYSPRGHSPNRERDSYSSNISSLSRASGSTPVSSATAGPVPPSIASSTTSPAVSAPLPAVLPLAPTMPAPLAAPMPAPLAAPLVTSLAIPLAAPTPTPAAPTATHLTHSLAPVPTVVSISSSAKPPAHWGVTRPTGSERTPAFSSTPLFGAPLPPPNPNQFSAESLFQSSPGADLLRRELDNRFLAAAGAAGAFSVRTEMHHHQHQHTHVHQHPPPHHHQLYMPHHHSLFKDVAKMPLYRGGLGLGYPYSSSLLHPSAPYVPPAPLSSYAPKPVVSASSETATKPSRPAVVKTGKWNAMHVRIAWEIYNHQQQKDKSGNGGGTPAVSISSGSVPSDKEKLRSFPPPPAPAPPYRSPYELPPTTYLPQHHPHLGVPSPFSRYGAAAYPGGPPPPPFGLSPYGRELALSSSLHGVHHPSSLAALHDAWRQGPRAPAPPPVSVAAAVEARREHEERERARRDREERERRDKEERERRKQREREMERVRQRSPLRNGVPDLPKEERKDPPRPPPPLGAYPPPPAWDPYRAFDPLHHMRFPPFVEAAIRAEEDRAKMLSAYAAHHHQMKSGPLLHRGLPPHGPLPPLGPHAPLGSQLAPLPPLTPLAPLDLLKKEEPR